MLKMLKRYFFAGLFVWLPVLVTLFVVRFLVEFLDKTLSLLPAAYQPQAWLGYHIPGLGVVLTFVILLVTGLLATNFLGKKLLKTWESLLSRIPLVRSIHSSVKQMMHTLFSSGGQSFRKVLLIQYPKEGIWTIAFLTNPDAAIKYANGAQQQWITAFIPTTPNPTSGFLVMLDPSQVIELDMSVDHALKMVISLGAIAPGTLKELIKK